MADPEPSAVETARYKRLVETSNDLIWSVDLDGRFTFVNDAAARRILGYGAGDMEGRPFTDFLAPGRAAFDLQAFRSVLEGGSVFDYRTAFLRKDGSRVDMSFNAVPERVDGAIVGATGTGADISEIVRYAGALENSEERYRLLFENATEPIGVAQAGRIIFFNQAVVDACGYSADEIRAMPFTTLVHPDDVAMVVEHHRRRMLGEDVPKTYVMRVLRKDGGIRYMNLSGVRILWEGQPATLNFFSDITARVKAEEALRTAERLKQKIVDASPGLLYIYDVVDDRNVYVNEQVTRILGFATDDYLAKDRPPQVPRIRSEEQPERWAEAQDGEVIESEMKLIDRAGKPHWFAARETVFKRDDDGRVRQIVGAAQDITSRKAAEEELEFQAYHDPLTGLPNRALFSDRLEQALARARRRGQPLAVLYTDLDHLKRVNDTLGHSAGDQLLRQAADRFRSAIREEDTVARFGGDEFVILLGQVRDAPTAGRVAEKLVARMNEPMKVGGQVLRVSTSVGVSFWPTDGNDAETLLKHADNALYQAKAQGRDTYRMFTADMNAKVQRRLALEQALHRALPENRLSLVYQPQHRLSDGAVVCYEALLRWNDPDLGEVPPTSFIPLAEDTRLIQALGDWVLDTALADAGSFAPTTRVAVNVSAIQLRDREFARRVGTALRFRDVDPRRLELELTESARIAEDESIVETLAELRLLGVRVAVDDFGTGYASLSYLRRLAVDVVKIDRSFIAGVGEVPADSAIVLGILGMAHGLNLVAVAEGVETEAQRDFLTVAGCDMAQGYFFARPAPRSTFAA